MLACTPPFLSVCMLALQAMWPVVSAKIAPMLTSSDWKARRAALLAISLVSEGCKKFLVKIIRTVVEGIIPFLSDAHPRVRHVAVRCLGELIGDFSDPSAQEGVEHLGDPTATTSIKSVGHVSGTAGRARVRESLKSIQEAAGDLILPALTRTLATDPVPRVRAVAALACVNFTLVDYCSAETLGPYTDGLLRALLSVLNEVKLKTVCAPPSGLSPPRARACVRVCLSHTRVRHLYLRARRVLQGLEGAISSVGCIAQVIGEGFHPY
ncbi:hypothetical protein EON67_09345, partial [archaeon]